MATASLSMGQLVLCNSRDDSTFLGVRNAEMLVEAVSFEAEKYYSDEVFGRKIKLSLLEYETVEKMKDIGVQSEVIRCLVVQNKLDKIREFIELEEIQRKSERCIRVALEIRCRDEVLGDSWWEYGRYSGSLLSINR